MDNPEATAHIVDAARTGCSSCTPRQVLPFTPPPSIGTHRIVLDPLEQRDERELKVRNTESSLYFHAIRQANFADDISKGIEAW